jgi:DUF4097 and DUF4098 domain-containing protein YvlB
MKPTVPFIVASLALAIPAAAQDGLDVRALVRDAIETLGSGSYQGRNTGPEQTERLTRKARIGRDGRVSIANISGDIVVTAGAGDEVSIEAVKRTRGDRRELENVSIHFEERPGRVDVRTEGTYDRGDRNRRGVGVSVDYTVTVPASAALDLHSVSGSVKVTGVHGTVRAQTVSGDVATADTPRLESARSVSGNVSLTGASGDGDLAAGSVSGNITVTGAKARSLDANSVSGSVTLTDVTCDRLAVKTVSGDVAYAGTILKAGRYEITTHSGGVRLALANPAGFGFTASSFSGSVRSELSMTIGGGSDRDANLRWNRGRRTMEATYGDGSATLTIRTFSGNIVVGKQ